MTTDQLRVLAINSFPANGNAGLKMVMSILGTHVIPVPTLLLSGIGNMRGHERFAVPFEALLNSTLRLAKENGQSLVVYVGYLGNASQASIIASQIALFPDIIQFVLIDPVCGDNGKAYVSDESIDAWHSLLTIADIALPNITEAALLAGFRSDLSFTESDTYLAAFRQKYPSLECVITGIVDGDRVINRWIRADSVTDFSQVYHPLYLSGTGDTFASLFIWFLFYKKLSKEQAVCKAGSVMEMLIRQSVEAGHTDLVVSSGMDFFL